MTTNYNLVRDQITAQSENSYLYGNDTQANGFYIDKVTDSTGTHYYVNVGFGYNISLNRGTAEQDLQVAGILSADPRTSNAQWAIIQSYSCC
ncbi:MAG: hypothetical protein JO253_06185 [Alphaproteobacteria bacterium]|nr:hypothetical protein [Alphaproteobacteria bacterium]